MAAVDPGDIPLPAFLDPLLNLAADHIPPALYDFIITVLSHMLALVTSLFAIINSMTSWKPWEWDAQTVIPPLISLFAAYLALLSLYRTTSWMFRLGFWMAKWGVILGTIATGILWMMGRGGGNGGAMLGGLLMELLGGRAGGGRRANPRQAVPRPRVWDSFDRHREWQFQEEEARQQEGTGEVHRVIEQIVEAGGRAVREAGFSNVIGAVKSMVDRLHQEDGNVEDDAARTTNQRTRVQPPRRAKKGGTRNR